MKPSAFQVACGLRSCYGGTERKGLAPERTKDKNVVELLNQKRAELANATQALSDAERLLDTDRVIGEKQRVDVLRGFISRLENEAREELEVEGQRRAKLWQKKNAKEVASLGAKISAAQDVVRAKLREVVEAIKVEVALRASVEQLVLADEVVSARFGLSRSYTRGSVQVPDREDWVMPILLASDSMRPERIRPQGLIILTQASDTPEIRRRQSIKAVAEFNVTGLPVEVRAMLSEAPISPEVLETPQERARREDQAVIGTGRSDPVLAQAAAEAVALGVLGTSPNAGVHVHRG